VRKVLLSQHLARLYGVSALNQAVKRNLDRFPGDFMFQISHKEFEGLKSQIVTSNRGGLRRALPYAFTEQGIAMLSSVLRSPRAVEVNIAIMRTFVQLRRLMDGNRDLARSQPKRRIGFTS
jgi:ORF6N domain